MKKSFFSLLFPSPKAIAAFLAFLVWMVVFCHAVYHTNQDSPGLLSTVEQVSLYALGVGPFVVNLLGTLSKYLKQAE